MRHVFKDNDPPPNMPKHDVMYAIKTHDMLVNKLKLDITFSFLHVSAKTANQQHVITVGLCRC